MAKLDTAFKVRRPVDCLGETDITRQIGYEMMAQTCDNGSIGETSDKSKREIFDGDDGEGICFVCVGGVELVPACALETTEVVCSCGREV